jgi:hypothetical protein
VKRAALVLVFLLAAGLQVVAVHVHSLTGDGAYHLLAGHQALRYGQNTVNFEHPPLVKLLVALPLLAEDEPLAEPVRVEDALARANGVYAKAELVRRATIRGRYVALVVFVLPLLAACYLVGRRWGDRRTGIVLVLMTALSLSVLPYLTILQTDAAAALAFLLTLLAAAAYAERPGWRRAFGLGLASGLALAVKFSGVLLAPTVLAAFVLAGRPWRRRLVHLVAVGAVALLAVEATYLAANPRYDPDVGRETIRVYCANRGTLAVAGEMAPWEPALLAVERVDPRLAQWLTGLVGVRIQNAIGVYPSYAFGEVRSAGRWWYFPAVLAVKTPLAILAAAAFALAAIFRIVVQASRLHRMQAGRLHHKHKDSVRRWILPALTAAVYLAAAMTSNYNLGVRHLLPVLPLLYLPVARYLSRRPAAAALVVGVLAAESLALAPLWMSGTNTWWLGARNPTRFALGAGDLEYRQNFVLLARHAEEHGLRPLRVLYPTLPRAVLDAYLPQALPGLPGDAVDPGWYAVNVTVEQLVPALLAARPEDVYDYEDLRRGAERWHPYWRAVVEAGEDHGWVAGTFHLYRVP